MAVQLRSSAAQRHHDVLHDVKPGASPSVKQVHGAVVYVVKVESVNSLLGADQNDLVVRPRMDLKIQDSSEDQNLERLLLMFLEGQAVSGLDRGRSPVE